MKNASTFLSWLIPLLSIADFNFTFSATDSCRAAFMTASSGVTVGCVMYFCLKYTVSDTLFSPVSFIHILYQLQCSVDVTRYHSLTECGAHNALQLFFSWIWTAHPNAANGMQLKSCGTLRYTYADIFGVLFYCRSGFTCISVRGVSLPHSIDGNYLFYITIK